ncbi:MAG: GatB/YqeY domain-containing protein [Candidatus Marinimicrobia bacterium]|nr:GatB/YqeY domain-containing protein [Candidatus Neomarinimicrobiota bacterium]
MKAKIQADMKQALKKKEALVVSTLRLLLAEIHNQEIEKQKELTDEEIVGVVQKEVKRRKEAIEAYRKGKREDLLTKEKKEMALLNNYLPQPLSAEELETTIQSVIKELGATGPADFGKVMGPVMAKVKGKADGQAVSEAVKKVLGS